MRIPGVDTIVGKQYHQTCQLRRHVMFAHRRSPSNKCYVHFRQFIQFAVVYLSFHPSLRPGKNCFRYQNFNPPYFTTQTFLVKSGRICQILSIGMVQN